MEVAAALTKHLLLVTWETQRCGGGHASVGALHVNEYTWVCVAEYSHNSRDVRSRARRLTEPAAHKSSSRFSERLWIREYGRE